MTLSHLFDELRYGRRHIQYMSRDEGFENQNGEGYTKRVNSPDKISKKRPTKSEKALRGILRNQCPSCEQGSVFRGLKMNKACPQCHYPFEREPGYYLGVIILGYFISCFSTVPTLAILIFVLQWPYFTALLIASGQVLLIAPILLRFARLLWLYLDYFADPNRHLHKN